MAVERQSRPDISRTKTSRESDKIIENFTVILMTFVAIWLMRGYFTQSERQQLSTLFRRHAEAQYFLGQEYADKVTGEPKPITKADVDAIEKLAEDAERNFLAELEKKSLKDKPKEQMKTLAEQTSSDLGIRSLNRGTLSNARLVEFVSRRDQRVCPICEDLDGDVYEVDPATGIIKGGPVIPDDTHVRCRCRYLLLEGQEEIE